MNSTALSTQLGMTLLEIMLALALSLGLLAGIMQIYSSSIHSYRLLLNQSSLQENGRFAMAFIKRDIRLAGFRDAYSASAIAEPIGGTDGVGEKTDTLAIRVATKDCSGTISYAIKKGVAGYPSLFRKGCDNKSGQALVAGIDNLQILYGADHTGDNSVNYYATAGTTGLAMASVVSVRIELSAQPTTGHATASGINMQQIFSSTIALRNRLP